jgi:TrpR-related protein YerC/YecD
VNSKYSNEESIKELYKAMLIPETAEEYLNFLADLCTVAEIRAMAQRLQVAKMLKAGKVYSEIVETTGASTATISRVNRSLFYGGKGYETVLKRLEEK